MSGRSTSDVGTARSASNDSLSTKPERTETVADPGLTSSVRSPDQVWLALPLAGPTSRIAAYAIDALLLWSAFAALVVFLILTTSLMETWGRAIGKRLGDLVAGPTGDEAAAYYAITGFVLLILLQAALEVAYFVCFEQVSGGRSPGKRVLRLRVVREGGQRVDLQGSLVRNLLRAVDILPANYFAGLIAMLASASGKRLGDWAAGTIVVREDRPARALPWDEPDPEGGPLFALRRDHMAHFGSTERRLARQTLRRLEALPEEQREVVLERAVEALRLRLGFEGDVSGPDRAAFLRSLLRAKR